MNRNISTLSVKVTYNRKMIIDKLQEYRTSHIDHYKQALYNYRVDLAAKLKDHTTKLEKYDGLTYGNPLPPYVSNNFGLQIPINETKNYDKLIKIFVASTDETVELSIDDADKLLNDEWDWIRTAKLINETYYNEVDSSFSGSIG